MGKIEKEKIKLSNGLTIVTYDIEEKYPSGKINKFHVLEMKNGNKIINRFYNLFDQNGEKVNRGWEF